MANNLELKLILSGDGKQLVAVTKDAQGRIQKLGAVSTRTSGKMSRAMHNTANSIAALNKKTAQSIHTFSKWSGVMGGITAAALGGIVASANRNIDALAKTADKIGITTESLAGLQYAGELTGVSLNTMNMALQRMTRRISEAASGTGEAKDAIKELGLDAQELERIGPDKAFVKISEAMKGVESQSDRVRLAMKLFDSEGVALVNTMNLGADGLNRAAKEAEQFGLAISRVDAARVEAANDAMTRASSVMTGMGTALAVEVAPYIEAVANGFAKSAAEAGGFGDVAGKALEYVSVGIGVMADGLHGIDILFTGLKVAANGFGVFVAHIFESLDRAAVNILNLLPGVSLQYSSTLSEMKDSFIQSTGESFDALQAKLMEPLPSEQIKDWMAEVKAETDKKNAEIEQATKQSHAAIQTAAVEHGKTMTAIALENGKQENAAVKAGLNQQIKTREQFTASLIDQAESAYQRRAELLKRALEGELIDHEQYSEKIARQQAQMQRDIAQINRDSERLYREYLNNLAAESDNTAKSIANNMAGAASAMAGSFRAAAAESAQAMRAVQTVQPQRIIQRSGNSNSPYYDGRNRRVIGYTNPGGFGVNVPVFNERRIRRRGGGRTIYYHTGGIVGKDLGSREVATTLRKDEGVFTENQMKALAPVNAVNAAIAAAIKQHGSGQAANANMDGFLAEYARINAKHVENFEIAAIRFNDRFAETVNSIPQPKSTVASLPQATAFKQYQPAPTQFAQYTGQPNGLAQQPVGSVAAMSAEQRYKLMLEYLGLPGGTKTAIYTRDNTGKLVQDSAAPVRNLTSTQKRVVGNKVIGEFKGGLGLGGGFTRQEGYFVDPAKLEAFFAKKTGSALSPGFEQGLQRSIEQISENLKTVLNRNSTGRRSDADLRQARLLQQALADKKTLLNELQNAKLRTTTGVTASAQLATTQASNQPIYGGLAPLQAFTREHDRAQKNIRSSAVTTNDKIKNSSEALWKNARKDVDGFKNNFRGTMTNVVEIYRDAAKQIEQQPINIQTKTEPTGGNPTPGGSTPQPESKKPGDRSGEPGWTWDPAREEWKFNPGYFHAGGIVGKDKSSREVATTLRKDEGVFTPNQMAALAPISSIIPVLKNINTGNKVDVHVHEAPNTQTQVTQTQQPDGSLRIDVIASAVEQKLSAQIRRGTGIGRTLKQQFGLRRAV